jgi:hypothetical protein
MLSRCFRRPPLGPSGLIILRAFRTRDLAADPNKQQAGDALGSLSRIKDTQARSRSKYCSFDDSTLYCSISNHLKSKQTGGCAPLRKRRGCCA